jgi:hypothetical protein
VDLRDGKKVTDIKNQSIMYSDKEKSFISNSAPKAGRIANVSTNK